MLFGDRCLWCMRCIYGCPMKAITNEHMGFFILEGGYSLERLAKLELEPFDFGEEKLDFWTRYFRKYFSQEFADSRRRQ